MFLFRLCFIYLSIVGHGRNSHTCTFSPTGANEWANPDSGHVQETNCYQIVDISTKQKGDSLPKNRKQWTYGYSLDRRGLHQCTGVGG